jgi:hypothetical protein
MTGTLIALPSGTCADMAVRIAVNSFFDGATPVLADRLESSVTAASNVDQAP